MSLLKLLVITAFIGLTVEEINLIDCENVIGNITETNCLNTLMKHGDYCCYLKTDSTERCVSLMFNETWTYTYYQGEIGKNQSIERFVCPTETKYVPNNCGAVGVTVPQSKDNCTRAKIPEQHCCYLTYKKIDGGEQSSACRRFTELKKSDEDYDIKEDDEVTEDLAKISSGNSLYEAVSIQCSHLFIKLSLLNIFVIMISLL